MNQNINNDNLYPDGGFPLIKLCTTDNITDKTKKEFSSKNIMSIQNILDKRRNFGLNKPIKQSRLTTATAANLNPNNDINTNSLTFDFKIDNMLDDISDLNISNIMNKSKRSTTKKSKGSKKMKKSKGSKK